MLFSDYFQTNVGKELRRIIRPRLPTIGFALFILLLNRVSNLALPILARPLIDDVLVRGTFSLLPKILAAAVSAIAVQAVTSYILALTIVSTGHEIALGLKKTLQEHMLYLPLGFFDQTKAGELSASILQDTERVANFFGSNFIEALGGLLTALIAFIFLVMVNRRITGVVAVTILIYALVLARGFPIVHHAVGKVIALTTSMTGRLVEVITGIRVIKAYSGESREMTAFGAAMDDVLASSVTLAKRQSLLGLVASTIIGCLSIAVMYMSAEQNLHSRFTAGGYVTCSLLVMTIIAPIGLFTSIGRQASEALAGLKRAGRILDTPREPTMAAREQTALRIMGHIRFHDVRFEYSSGHSILRGISFSAEPGRTIAIVGASGAGKTTIINLLCGFYRATGGVITIDGMDLAKMSLLQYRSHLGVAFQEPFLFHGTIRDNITLGAMAASHDEIVAACAIARVDEFVEQMPANLESVVGERGTSLSGGQRQRIALARAIVKRPQILLLDEATSGLDQANESFILDSLASSGGERTTIVVAHRLSTIRNADEVLFLVKGEIVERGRHDDLVNKSLQYRQFAGSIPHLKGADN